MANQHKGSCLCGRVQYQLSGEFQSFFLCHCARCQKDTGSAHAANLFAQDATLIWTQGESQVNTFQLPNSLHAKSFCQCCGSALPTIADAIKCVVVPAGSLDSPVAIAPTAKIFMGSCAHWAKDLANVPDYEKLPGQDNN
ncbi:GFA family protein [Vibrio sp.]|uniref:GFA family protein n=1 Tax=Vibrio sp. TaxID=678 RepID=UPI003D1036A7